MKKENLKLFDYLSTLMDIQYCKTGARILKNVNALLASKTA